jgi:hypothetical protein
MLRDLESKRQQKMSKEDKIRKEEGKLRTEICLEHEPIETARARMTAISQNSRMPLQNITKKNKPTENHKQGYNLEMNKVPGTEDMPVCYGHF